MPIFSRYIVALLLCLLVPIAIPATGWTQSLASVRNWQILSTLGFAVFMLARKQDFVQAYQNWRMPGWVLPCVYGAGLIAFLSSCWLHFLGFRVNGIDFSTFDLMLWNTRHGRFMYSPMIAGNHFAVHLSWIMLPLVPIHALFESPWFLVSLHALVTWAGLFPLERLARRYLVHDAPVVLLLLAYLTHARVGSLINHGFHFEVFYLPFGLGLIEAWTAKNHRALFWWTLAFATVKEDAGLYLAGLGLGSFCSDSSRRPTSAALMLAGCVLFVMNVGVILPLFRNPGGGQPQYMSFWGQYGTSVPSILVGMLTQPQKVLSDLISSGWFELCASFLLIPFLSRQGLIACIPAAFILGTSASPQMHAYHGYYTAALLPFFILAFCEGSQRLQARPGWVFAALLTAPLLGGDYLRFPMPKPSQSQALKSVLETIKGPEFSVCVQTIFFPHLPYGLKAFPFTPACQVEHQTFALVNPALDTFPLTRAQMHEYLNQRNKDQQVDHGDGLIMVW